MGGQARRDAALLTGHGRPGIYLRVLQEGEVGAGDPITVVHRDPAGLRVRPVPQLLHTGARDDASLRAALAVPALSEGWKWSFRQLLASGDRPENPRAGAAAASEPAYPGFRRWTVTRVVRQRAHVVSVHLAPGTAGGRRPRRVLRAGAGGGRDRPDVRRTRPRRRRPAAGW